MQIFKVGGAVRDRVMREQGFVAPTSDIDWVVVGATPEAMLQEGFLPVGKDFPVFLHPQTHEEYALARTERKTARGYHGFTFHTAPDVTIEADLYRRDLTINAMAEASDGTVIDPYGGVRDIALRKLRHVSPAFCEDPVRILRIARFSARFPNFSIAPETQQLLCKMVDSGEADALVAERVWSEISKGLMEKEPSKMLSVLIACRYWPKIWSNITITEKTMADIDKAAQLNEPFNIRAAILFSGITDHCLLKDTLKAMRVQSDVSELTALLLKNHQATLSARTTEEYFEILDSSDILRRPHRFRQFVRLLELIDGFNSSRLLRLVDSYTKVDVKYVAHNCKGKNIRKAISDARLVALIKQEQSCHY